MSIRRNVRISGIMASVYEILKGEGSLIYNEKLKYCHILKVEI